METFLIRTKPFSCLLIFSLWLSCLHPSPAYASLVGTEAVINAAEIEQDRQRLHDALDRDDVKSRLIAHGVDPAQVQARVDSLTDQETQNLAAKMERSSPSCFRMTRVR